MEEIWGYDVIRTGSTSTVKLAGEIDLSVGEEVYEVLAAEVSRPDIAMVRVDLSGVGFMGSTGLHVLVRAKKAANALGRGFAVVGAKGSPLRALTISQLLPYLNDEPTMPDHPQPSSGASDQHAS